MATGPDQPADERRPRPTPHVDERPDDAPTWPSKPSRTRWRGRAAPDSPLPGQLLSTTAGAVVTAARVGRLLGRTGWRLARQLPGVEAVEATVGGRAQRIGQAAAQELLRILEVPQQTVGLGNPEERRVMMLLQDAGTDPEPLRTAMGELLQRSSASDGREGRDYLFGTIISQLVPDEARILAALAGGRRFAVVDVLTKHRSTARTVLANASTVGAAARVALPADLPTYLTRLHSFGLIEFKPIVDGLDAQFAQLNDDPAVRAARAEADGRFGNAKIIRKSVVLSSLGREFWNAAAPSHRELRGYSG